MYNKSLLPASATLVIPTVVDSKAVTIAKNEIELHEHLDEALRHPELRNKYRKSLLDLEIGAPLEGTSERIVEALKKM